MAVGSLPYNNIDQAMSIVKENFSTIPYWPQLAKINKNEDMIFQYTENLPSFFYDEENNKIYLETESKEFFENLETFFVDYEEIILGNDELLNKYGISSDYACAFESFIEIVGQTKPDYAKGQIVGPFTLATSLNDKNGKCAIYDETLKEIIIKTLSLKALWQIKRIKQANPQATPIIFIDEPSISQLGTSAFLTISPKEVVEMFREISDLIKNNGGLSAIHCCGKCDWTTPINAGISIVNLDAYSYAQNLSVFNKQVEKYLLNGGKIAWGVVPTLDKNALEKADLDEMISVFKKGVKYLTQKGIDEKIIIDNSLITPSCGAGGLSEELACKAMKLTRQLSVALKEIYSIDS